MPRRRRVRTGAVVVVAAAAAAAAPSPLAIGAVLLAAAWAAAWVVACASCSSQAGSCLGASALSFQLRWPVAAPADPNRHRHWKRPSSRRTRVRACEGQRRQRGPTDSHLQRARRARGTGAIGAGRGAPCRGGGRGFRDGPTAAALAASSRAGSAARAMAARRDPRRAIYAACSATAARMRCRTHLRGTCRRAAAAWPDLPSAALEETSPKGKTHQHANTQTRKQRPAGACSPLEFCAVLAQLAALPVCNACVRASAPARGHRRIRLLYDARTPSASPVVCCKVSTETSAAATRAAQTAMTRSAIAAESPEADLGRSSHSSSTARRSTRTYADGSGCGAQSRAERGVQRVPLEHARAL